MSEFSFPEFDKTEVEILTDPEDVAALEAGWEDLQRGKGIDRNAFVTRMQAFLKANWQPTC